MTQAGLAVTLGVTATTVARWERGEQVIGHPDVVRLALDRLEQRSKRKNRSNGRPPSVSRVRLPEPVQERAHNLPTQVSTFVGRERELRDVKRLLARTRLLTVTGTGGVGKTRLALQVAADLVGGYADGTWFVELAPITQPVDVARAVAAVLHIVEHVSQPLVDTLTSKLTNRRLLLVLDNCEHLLQASAELVHAVLSRCQFVRILTTSRERLGLAGEVTWQIPALSLPAASGLISAKAAAESESVQLFVERATEVVPTFAMTDENAADVASLCRQLEGVPLALELAAARVHALSVKQIATRLDDRPGLLVSASRTAPLRHQTVSAAVEWSYQLLPEAERRIFNRLSVFVGGWTLDAAETVVAERGETARTVDVLCQLVSKSLVITEPRADGQVRYRQLELLRQFASQRLLESGDGSEIREQHAVYYLALAEQAQPEPDTFEMIPGLDRLEADGENLRCALQWYIDREDLDGAQRLASALWPSWYVGGHTQEGWNWLARVMALRGANSPSLMRAKVLFGASVIAYRRGKHQVSEDLAEECLTLSRQFGDPVLVACSLTHLGNLARMTHRFSHSRRLLDVAVAEARAAGCPAAEVQALDHLARLDSLVGHQDAARVRLEKALVLATERKNVPGIVGVLRGLGEVAHKCGDYGAARSLLEDSYARAQQRGDWWRAAMAELTLGYLMVDLEEGERAGAIWTRALQSWRDQGNLSQLTCVLEGFGYQAARHGEVKRALRIAGAADAVRRTQARRILPVGQFWLDRWLPQARRALSAAEVTAAWARGEAMSLDEAIAYATRQTDAESPDQRGSPKLPDSQLTPREQEVVSLIVLGRSDREIACSLVISEHTAHTHVRNVLRKLGLQRRVQIATWGLRTGTFRLPAENT